MTREEAIIYLRSFAMSEEQIDAVIDAFTCEDCISRQDVIRKIHDTIFTFFNVCEDNEEIPMDDKDELLLSVNKAICNNVKAVKSVIPEPKIGRWIEDAKTYYEELNKRGLGVDEYTPYFTDDIACSECLAKYSMLDNETQFFKHCPNCGAKMESEEE